MKPLPAMGGVRLGPDGLPCIQIVPIPFQPGGIASSSMMRRAIETVRDASTTWFSARDAARYGLRMPAALRSGLLGKNTDDGLQIHFVHGKQSPVDALYTIEEHEEELDYSLAGALLAAAQAKSLPKRTPAVLASLCSSMDAGHSLVSGRLNRRDLDGLVEGNIATMVRGHGNIEVPAGAVDRARFWLLTLRRLWDPEVQARLAFNFAHERNIERSGEIMQVLATTWLDLQDIDRIRIKNTDLQLSHPVRTLWPQVMEWVRHDVPDEALRFLVRNRMSGEELVVCMESDPGLVDCDPVLCQRLKVALLEEAEREAAFVPNGAFELEVPEGYPLHRLNVKSLRVWAEPTGLWVALVTESNRVGEVFRWEPGQPTDGWVVEDWSRPLVEVTLAALWRDLRVAGEEALPDADVERAARPGSQGRRGHRRASVRVLPAPARPGVTGVRSWGSGQEREAIRRRTHGVRGHLRRLNSGRHAGPQAQKLAAEFGIVLPADMTFVRPHFRGSERQLEGEESGPTTAVIRARGLASVMAFLGN